MRPNHLRRPPRPNALATAVAAVAAAAALSLTLACPPRATGAATAPDWNQWRGPDRDAVLRNAAPWPKSLAPDRLQRAWRVPLGPSYSGPLVTSDRVFTTESRDNTTESVIAFDRATGREAWRHAWEGYMKVPFFARANGDWIRATPALSEGRLYVGGMRDVLVCLDAASGREVWRFDFPRQLESALPSFGFVSSPLVQDGSVYVQAGGGFVRLDAATGKLLWKTLDDGGGMWGSAFSSPVLTPLAGTPQLLVQTRDKLAGVSPADGTVLWQHPIKAFRGMNILTPVAIGDLLFTSAYGGQTQGWKLRRAGQANAALEEQWHLKLEGYMSTPVIIDGHAYLHTRAQRLACVEVATGRRRWESDDKYGKYMSLVANSNDILALDQRGVLYLIEASPAALRIRDERRLTDSETWAHLAVRGDVLAVREQDALALWTWAP